MPANTLEVKSHLILAKQFLAAGLIAVADGHNNAGATLAVNAVIHVKDAICLLSSVRATETFLTSKPASSWLLSQRLGAS